VRAVLLVLCLASVASADDLCARKLHHGAPIDLDVKDADVHDVLRLLADVGRTNLVVSDEVTGKVTLRLKRVAWDLAACTIAKVHHLAIALDDNVLLVTKR
jgi:type IV pilus assembly protein PilQ